MQGAVVEDGKSRERQIDGILGWKVALQDHVAHILSCGQMDV